MQTFIVKACDITETKTVQSICDRLLATKKMYVCSGETKVGKTALSIKMLHTVLSRHSDVCKPLILAFDQNICHWMKQIKEDKASQNLYDLYKIIFLFPYWADYSLRTLRTRIFESIKNDGYNFIIIDGIDKTGLSEKHLNELLVVFSFLTLYGNYANVFINTTESFQLQEGYLYRKLKENNLVEYWHLTRPDYLYEDIREFGDTKLEIH